MATDVANHYARNRTWPARGWHTVVVIACLTAMTAVAFWPVLSNDFVHLDDPAYVTHNEDVKRGLTFDGFVWAFKEAHAGYWHPLTWLSH
ncbi:MAG: hypothetical protein L0Y42_08430, partial [Phycisphaerales bacterium]|nr:hypothetical protein [Phycisphaerales bacterium]